MKCGLTLNFSSRSGNDLAGTFLPWEFPSTLLIFPWTWSPVLLSCQTRLGWVLWGWVHSGVGAHRVCVHRVDAYRVEATEMGTPRDGCSRMEPTAGSGAALPFIHI